MKKVSVYPVLRLSYCSVCLLNFYVIQRQTISMMPSLRRAVFLFAVFIAMLALPSFITGWEGIALIKSISAHFVLIFIALTLIRWASLVFRWYFLLSGSEHHLNATALYPMVLAIDFMGDNSPASVGGLAGTALLFKQKEIPFATTIAYCNLIFVLDLAAVGTVMLLAVMFSIGTTIDFFGLPSSPFS